MISYVCRTQFLRIQPPRPSYFPAPGAREEIFKMGTNWSTHIGEEELESYAMASLARDRYTSLEEHLLVCQNCRDRLDAADAYVHSVRAAEQQVKEPEPSKVRWLGLAPPLVWTCAAAVLVVGATVFFPDL